MTQVASAAHRVEIVAAGSAPAWFNSQSDNTWTAIASSTGQRITDHIPSPVPHVDTFGDSPNSICTAWTGGSVDQVRKEYLLCANGGHGDYPGNECYALTLTAATPAWRRISAPTPNSSMTNWPNSGPDGLNLDGRPRAMHNTFQCFGNGRVWMPYMNSVTSGNGGHFNRQISFNRDLLGAALTPAPYSTNPWNDYGSLSGVNNNVAGFGVAVHHNVRNRAYGLAGNGANNTNWWFVNTSGGSIGTGQAFTSSQTFGHWGTWAVCASDLDIVVAGDHLRNAVCVLNCATNTWTQVTNITGSGYYQQNAGGAYCPINKTIAVGNPPTVGNTFLKLQIPTSGGAYNPSGQWVWSQVAGGGSTITSVTDKAFSRWNIVEDMGNGRSALVFVGGIAMSTFVYKIPAAGL